MERKTPNMNSQTLQNNFSNSQSIPQQNIFPNKSQNIHISQNNMNFFNNNNNMTQNIGNTPNPNFMNQNMFQNINQLQNTQNSQSNSQVIKQYFTNISNSNKSHQSIDTFDANNNNANLNMINSMNMNNNVNNMNMNINMNNNMNNMINDMNNINNINNMNNMTNNMNAMNMNMNNNMLNMNDINISNNMNNMNINNMNNMNINNVMNNNMNISNMNNDINNMNINMNMNMNNMNNDINNNMNINMSMNMNNMDIINSNKNPIQNILNNNEQNILNEISNTHSIKLSTLYDYAPSQTTLHLNSLLKDMDTFGQITKKKIVNEQSSNPNKYFSMDEAFNSGDEHLKALAKVKYALNSEGCTCEINRNNLMGDELKEVFTTIQFIVNGMYKFKKYILRFDFGEEKNKKMLTDDTERNTFNSNLTKKLCALLNLKFKEIIINNPFKDSLVFSAIIKKENFNEIDEINLLKNLKNEKDNDFNMIINVEKTILLNGCILSNQMLDFRGDRNIGWGEGESRGGKPYFPPKGWNGYGLNVLDRYDSGDNTWIDFKNAPGEWSVAYHSMGTSLSGDKNQINFSNFNNMQNETVMRQKFKLADDKYHMGEKVGEGVYMTPNPVIMEQFCSVYQYGGETFKIGIMCRVRPEKIRCPSQSEDYWIINGTDNEVRPYRILIKNQ